MFSGWTTHPGDNTQCVGSREAGIVFRCTVDTRHQAAEAACCTGPSRAMDGACRDEMDAARPITRWKRTDDERKECGTPGARTASMCQIGVAHNHTRDRGTTMNNVTTYGLDLAKQVFQAHWVDVDSGEVHRKTLSRAQVSAFFARAPRSNAIDSADTGR